MCSPMPPPSTWVVKLGGAMLEASELPAWLAACAGDASLSTRCVVVAGGGGLADQVRALQARWQFDDLLAHQLALDTMRIHARMLHGLAPTLPLCQVQCAAELGALPPSGGLLWSPPRTFAPTALPASWAVTSDSIALWLAQALAATALILVKSLSAAALSAMCADTLAASGVVDAHFPSLVVGGEVPVRLMGKSQILDFTRHLQAGIVPGAALD